MPCGTWGGVRLSTEFLEIEVCQSCDLPAELSYRFHCAVCAPYHYREVCYKENLTPWAREMIENERDILDDVEPIRPPVNEQQWLELILQLLGDDYAVGHRSIPFEQAVESIRNYPPVRIECMTHEEDIVEIAFSVDGDGCGIARPGLNHWRFSNHWCFSEEGASNMSAEWIGFDERLQEAFAEVLSGVLASNPLRRTSDVRDFWVRAMDTDPFIVDSNTGRGRWLFVSPDSLLIRHTLAQILLGLHGQEPLWQLQAGIIADSICWRDYYFADWESPRKRSFQLLRKVVESTFGITTSKHGLMVQGQSGAVYLIDGRGTVHGDRRFAGDPITAVTNITDVDSLDRHVCIYTPREGGDLIPPLGDRIAALALGLLNDVETARSIEQLRPVVNHFLGGDW